jgi:hypothetical protein
MLEQIHEKISVITVHNRQKHIVMPYKIRWQGRDYIISKIGFHHKIWQGRNRVHIFSVSTGAIDFRLSYDTESLDWTLEEVSDGLS